MIDIVKNFWELDVCCAVCGEHLRSQGYTWVDPFIYYYYLKCGYCGVRLKGKTQSKVAYVPDWSNCEGVVPPRSSKAKRKGIKYKKFVTAKRKK